MYDNQDILGASPDSTLTKDTSCVQGIIEIRCLYSAPELTVKKACSQCSAFLYFG